MSSKEGESVNILWLQLRRRGKEGFGLVAKNKKGFVTVENQGRKENPMSDSGRTVPITAKHVDPIQSPAVASASGHIAHQVTSKDHTSSPLPL